MKLYGNDNERRSWTTDKVPDELLLSTIFQLYRSSHFIGGGNRRKPPTWKNTYIIQV